MGRPSQIVRSYFSAEWRQYHSLSKELGRSWGEVDKFFFAHAKFENL
jgi:hypothetical protein